MYRSTSLSQTHYANRWCIPSGDDFNNREEVNRLGITYACLLPGLEREAILLQLIEFFHSYLCKYLNMIIHGQLPPIRSTAGKDSIIFLKTLAPRGSDKSSVSWVTLSNICKTLHLAFKQNTSDDIYDILVLCLIRAVDKYDPTYTDKVRKVCDIINASAPKRRSKAPCVEFTSEEIASNVDFNSVGCIRMLVRKGFLASIAGPKKKIIGYRRLQWPPPKTFFESGPIGLTYFIQMYFRYYLHEYISTEMSTLESQDGVLQLDWRGCKDTASLNDRDLGGVPNIEGDYVDTSGQAWSADVTLMNLSLDVSEMTLDWVVSTEDKLFKKLTPMERNILRMVWLQEFTWKNIGKVMDCDSQTAKKRYEQIMCYLQARAKTRRYTR